MNFMTFALWTAVTFFRPFATAYSNANFTMRRVPITEMYLIEIAASSRILVLPAFSIAARTSVSSGVSMSNSIPA